jgi:hypothetical protein
MQEYRILILRQLLGNLCYSPIADGDDVEIGLWSLAHIAYIFCVGQFGYMSATLLIARNHRQKLHTPRLGAGLSQSFGYVATTDDNYRKSFTHYSLSNLL